MTWWWPCDIESKDEIPLVWLFLYLHVLYISLFNC